MVKIFMIGDIVGNSGINQLLSKLPSFILSQNIDFVVANGENAASGIGITKENSDAIFKSGVDVITSGNHIWEKPGIRELLASNSRILRPANYPAVNTGQGIVRIQKNNIDFVVINLQGRDFMPPIDSPFDKANALLEELTDDSLVIVDFHAESFAEKEALSMYIDDKAAVFVGTHTHVQTADERILPSGQGYIGDLGMTGPSDSVIGMKSDICIKRNITQMPIKMEVAEGPAFICGAIFTVDKKKSKWCCSNIERIKI